MEPVQSPEEIGKKILAQQAQEQRAIQETLDKEAKEEKERLRRLKERQIMVFLTYLKINLDEEKARRETEAFFEKLKEDFFGQHLQQAQLFNKMMLNNLERHDSAVANFLYSGESEEDRARRNAQLEKADMNLSDFSALAIADLCKREENTEDVEKVFSGKLPSEELIAQRAGCVRHADEALTEFNEGKIEKMEEILKGGLVNACHAFASTKDPLNAIHWSKQINGIMSIINSHPVLFKDGVDSPLLEAAIGMAAIGRVMENGMKALDELHTAQLNGTKLTPEAEQSLQAQVLLMQQTDNQRSNEQYHKFFAKGYSPVNGFRQENLKSLLKQLNSSEAMYTLSAMSPEERVFSLSDVHSRKSLSEQLLVAHAEKKAPAKHTTAPEAAAERKLSDPHR